jgi:hypothetical protein
MPIIGTINNKNRCARRPFVVSLSNHEQPFDGLRSTRLFEVNGGNPIFTVMTDRIIK